MKLTLEKNEEAVRRITSVEQGLARREPHLVSLLRQPCELLLRHVGEDFVFPQVFEETHNFARY